ncbi:MAG: nucleoside monophosphate kinase [Patescibacteria group bacterium]
MTSKVFIFIGRSGVGKGTQATYLKEYLEKKDTSAKTLYFVSGDGLREFLKEPSYTAGLAKKIYDAGGLFPEFLVIYNWSRYFISNITGNEHLILDGTPRKVHEAAMLDTALEFYGKKDVSIVWMHGSREWSTKLLLGRGRSDDTPDNITRRLDWYEDDVAATIEYYKKHGTHTLVEINAEQARPDVHAEIVRKLGI